MSDTMSAVTQPGSALGGTPPQLPDSALVTEQGKTTIADAVVAKIAGIATREVSGVRTLGGGTARAVGALRARMAVVAPTTQRVSQSRSANDRLPSTSSWSPSTACPSLTSQPASA